jgi:5-methylcytosine-specific restriction endonuclease McrA
MITSGWLPRSTRLALYSRDGATCVYCGCRASKNNPLSLDHIECRSWGGALKDPSNLVTACHHCNSCRQDMTLPEFQRYLNRVWGISTKGLHAKIKRLTSKPLEVVGRKSRKG